MNEAFKRVCDTYTTHRGLVLDFLRHLSDESLTLTVGPGMGPLGKQFRHVGNIELCYIEALRTGSMDFRKQRRGDSLEESKERLVAFLERNDDELFEVLGRLGDRQVRTLKIDWQHTHQKLGRLSVLEHLQQLIAHEILHEGELVVYARILRLALPPTWRFWGLSE